MGEADSDARKKIKGAEWTYIAICFIFNQTETSSFTHLLKN